MKTSLLSCFLGVVGRSRRVSRGRLVDRGRGVGGGALVPDIHHVAGVAISSVVGDNLGAAVGEEDAVLTIGGVAITGLVGTKLDVVLVAILGINTILVLVLGGSLLISRLVVGGCRLVDSGRGIRGRGVGGHSRGRGGKGEEGDTSLQQRLVFMRQFPLEIILNSQRPRGYEDTPLFITQTLTFMLAVVVMLSEDVRLMPSLPTRITFIQI